MYGKHRHKTVQTANKAIKSYISQLEIVMCFGFYAGFLLYRWLSALFLYIFLLFFLGGSCISDANIQGSLNKYICCVFVRCHFTFFFISLSFFQSILLFSCTYISLLIIRFEQSLLD